MRGYYWVIILVVLIVFAFILTYYIKKKNETLDEKKRMTSVPDWMKKPVKANKPAKEGETQENYINFNFSTLADFNEARAVQLLSSRHPTDAENPKVFSKEVTINKIMYTNDYENKIAVSNTMQIFDKVIVGKPDDGNFVCLNNIARQPVICYGIVLPANSSIGFYVDSNSTFPFFSAEGVLSISSPKKIEYVPTNNTGIYNIVGKDIHQKFIISQLMSEVTFLFLGNLLILANITPDRYYGAVFLKPISRTNLNTIEGVSLDIRLPNMPTTLAHDGVSEADLEKPPCN